MLAALLGRICATIVYLRRPIKSSTLAHRVAWALSGRDILARVRLRQDCENVVEIRQLQGREAGRSVALRFGVCTATIHHVWSRRTWRDVAEPEVTSGAWIARKDGRVFITGNSWPVALAARLIRVLTSERGRCPECGAPWVRQVEREASDMAARYRRGEPARHGADGAAKAGASNVGAFSGAVLSTGWAPTCAHDAEPVPCVVLDPFAGIGRSWEAARETGRRFVGTDLGLGYCRLARSRNDLAAAARRREAERAKVRTITGPLFGGRLRS